MGRARERWINVGVLLVSTALAVLLCEVLLRGFVRVGSFRWVSENGKAWNREDPLRDYVLTPGFVGRLEAPEFSNRVEINSFGFRGPEIVQGSASPERERPVFVVGDSFVFGVGAEREQALPARLALHLGLDDERGAWNLGVPSHSSPQYRITLDHYRRHAEPSLVVVCLFLGRLPSDANDLWGAVTFETARGAAARARAEPSDAEAPPRRPLPRRIVRFLKRNSALYTFVAGRIAPLARARLHERRRLQTWEQERFEQGWTLLRRDLRAMAAAAEEADAPLVLAHVPEASDVINGRWEAFERLSDLAHDLGLPLVDPRPFLTPSSAGRLYYPVDGHLNPDGYDRWARAVAVTARSAQKSFPKTFDPTSTADRPDTASARP